MEVSLISCLPLVQPENIDSCENNSFNEFDSDLVIDCGNDSEKDENLNSSTSPENVELKRFQDGTLFQAPPQNSCDDLIFNDRDKELHCGTEVRVEADDVVLDSVPKAEVFSHVNDGISIENFAYNIESPTTPDTPSEVSTSLSTVNSPASETRDDDIIESVPDFSERKKRYFFNFRPKIENIITKETDGDSYKCYTCGGVYRQKFSLKRHFLRTHIDYRFISEADIANCKIPVPSYITQHSNAENTPNGRKKFKKSSDDVFLENNDLGLMPGLYRCHDCTDVSFDTDVELRDHYNEHPDSIKKKYECSKCHASFIKKQILSRHLASHAAGSSIRLLCRKCNVDFSSKDELDRHMATHSSGKTCRICEKVLSNVANRKRHERLHLNSGKRCPHCDQCFAQRKELDRHIKSQHANLRRTCDLCDQMCSSVESLASHVKEKHRSSPKLPDDPDESIPKPKPTRVCFVCKRVFPTVYAMLKHRRNAHPFHTRRKRHRKTGKTKNAIVHKDANVNEYRKTYIGPGRPKGSGKKMAVGVKSEFGYMGRRERVFIRRTRKEEVEFYSKVHENIAYNLTNYIEGTARQLSLNPYHSPDISDDFEVRVNLPWQFYNFPSWYNVNKALKRHQTMRPTNLSIADEFLHNATGLTPTHLSTSMNPSDQNTVSSSVVSPANECNYSKEFKSIEKRKLLDNEVISVLVCHVCKEEIESHEEFAEHCINNHPNVQCSYVEILGDKDSPPKIPPEMCKTNVSPVGLCFAYDVPPIIHRAPVSCTKCRKLLRTVPELHEHIVVCGNLMNSKPRHKNPLSLRHIMRKRMTMAQFRSGFNNRSGRTPEKRLIFVNKVARSICDTTSRSERILFYKKRHLQTTSLTVDKNYFNTKPMKPIKTGMSKRGRKSYEEKSLAYRYATMQPSTSRECPHCRIVFASIQMLNNHVKHCSQRSPMKIDSKSVWNLCSKSAPKSDRFIKNTIEKETESVSGNNSAVCNSFNFQSSSSSAASSEDLSFQSQRTPENKKSFKHLSSSELSNSPMDLSKNTNDNNKSTSPVRIFNQNTFMTKSAVQIAMEAVQQHMIEQPDDNEPISKLQQITEKIVHHKSSTKSPLVSPVLKSGSGKKVGRPRKLKKEASTPIPARKELIFDISDNKSPSKPKKLEEIVKEIKENKVKGGDSRLQNKESPELKSVFQKANCGPPASISKINHLNNNDACGNLIIDKKVGQNISQRYNYNPVDTNKLKKSTDSFSIASDINQISSQLKILPASKLPEKSHVQNVSRSLETSSAGVKLQEMPQKHKEVEITLSISHPSVEKSDNAAQDSSEFECLLKSINQRLLSEDKNQQDDSTIPWLEDEKFEIPPSRTSLGVIGPSNAEKTPIKTGSSIIPSIVTPLKDKRNEEPRIATGENIVSQGTTQDLQIKTVIANNEEPTEKTSDENKVSQQLECKFVEIKTNSGTVKRSILDNGLLQKNTSVANVDKPVLARENSTSCKSLNIPKTVKSEARSYRKFLAENSKSLVSPTEQKDAPKTIKSTVTSSEKRKPGRPRKKPLEVQAESSNMLKALSPVTNVKVTDIQIVKNDALTNLTASLNSSGSDVKRNDTERKSTSPLLVSVPLSKGSGNFQSSTSAANSNKPMNQALNQRETSDSLKNVCLKTNAVLDNENNSSKSIFKSSTTEFGKNLASKMKEKMRLSLEQDLPKLSAEDASNSNCGSENSETCSLMSTDEKPVKVIKKEFETAENQKIHYCPYCMLEFAYLTNFRRHIKQCKARDQAKELEPVPGTQSMNLQYLPKKDEVDYCMLNLYRFQSRQTDILKEEENVNKHIKTYECNICHKIYLNLFNLIQHKLSSHKLVEQNNPGCPSEINEMNILSLAGRLVPDSSQPESESIVDQKIILNNLPNLLENFEKPGNTQNSNNIDDHDETKCAISKNLSTKLQDETIERVINHSLMSEDSSEKIEKQSEIPIIRSEMMDNNKNNENRETLLKEKVKMEGSFNILDRSKSSMNLSNESSPVKRKRGRPVGWRKNQDVGQEIVVKNKKIKGDGLKKSFFKLKKGEISHSTAKLKSVTKKIILDDIKKKIAEKKSKKFPVQDKLSIESSPVKYILDEKVTPFNPSVNKLPVTEADVKTVSKRPYTTPATEYENIPNAVKVDSETNFVKSPFKLLQKSPVKTEASPIFKTNIVKRGRGRPPWKNLVPVKRHINLNPVIKSEDLPKRRPGRPPKNSLSSSNQLHSIKIGIASSSNAKNSKRTLMPVFPLNVDSSDSDSHEVKNEFPVKKKINFKCCALCSDKFVSSLELKRHIQLKHNRRKPDDNKYELQKKILKKLDSRSSSMDAYEGVGDVGLKRCDSPQRKITPTPAGKKSDIVKSNHRTIQIRKTEPNTKSMQTSPSSPNLKSPPSSAVEGNKDISPMRNDITTKKLDTTVKKVDAPQKNQKICAICKQKFLNGALLLQHLQIMHNRKSEPIVMNPMMFSSPGRKSQSSEAKSSPLSTSSSPSPVRKKKELSLDRSPLPRQCRKPLPPLKRRKIKKEPSEQIPKKFRTVS